MVYIFGIDSARGDPATRPARITSRQEIFSPIRQSIPLFNQRFILVSIFSIGSFGAQDSRLHGDEAGLQIPEPQEEKIFVNCRTQINKCLAFNSSCQLFLLTYLSYVMWDFSYKYIFIQFWIQDTITIYLLIHQYYSLGTKWLFKLGENLYMLLFKVLIVIYYDVGEFRLDYVAIFMFVIQITRFLIKVCQYFYGTEKGQLVKNNSYQKLSSGVQSMITLQLTLICLKWEKYLFWGWNSVLMCLWIALFIIMMMLLVSIYCLFESLIHYLWKKTNLNYRILIMKLIVIGTLWIFIMLLGLSLPSLGLLIIVGEYYNHNKQMDTDMKDLSYKIGVVMILLTFIFTSYTLKIKKEIELIYLEDIQGIARVQEVEVEVDVEAGPMPPQSQDLEVPVNEEGESQEPQQMDAKKCIQTKTHLKFDKVQIPLYLIKISSSYFEINYLYNPNKLSAICVQSPSTATYQKVVPKSLSQSLVQDRDFIPQKKQFVSTDGELKQNTLQVDRHTYQNTQQGQKVEKSQANEMSQADEKSGEEDEKSEKGEKCLICCENQANIVLLPCLHGGICNICAQDILINSQECFLCRQPIKQMLKLDTEDELKVVGVTQIDKENYNG